MTDLNSSDVRSVSDGRLQAFVARLERLAEDRAAVAEDIKLVFQELKGDGYDARAVRAVLKFRKEDKAKRAELDAVVALYLGAVGEG